MTTAFLRRQVRFKCLGVMSIVMLVILAQAPFVAAGLNPPTPFSSPYGGRMVPDTLTPPEQVVAWRGQPQAIRIDNGPELRVYPANLKPEVLY